MDYANKFFRHTFDNTDAPECGPVSNFFAVYLNFLYLPDKFPFLRVAFLTLQELDTQENGMENK